MTPIRETIARAICAGMARRDGDPYIDDSEGFGCVVIDGPCNLLSAADAVLRALDEAGLVVVRKDAATAPDERGLR